MPLLLALPRAAAAEPDTTPPSVVFDPCGTGIGCQRYEATDYDAGPVDDDLAEVGARIGDQVLDSYVYNDGTGPQPYGPYVEPYDDVFSPVEWALRFVVPAGTNDIVFYARDLAGNTTEQTFSLTAATLPGRPDPTAQRTGRYGVRLLNLFNADAHGWQILEVEVRGPSTQVRRLFFSPPIFGTSLTYPRLKTGLRTFKVRVRNEVGWSGTTTVRKFIPRKR